jgi:hypothetical protein
VRFRAAVLNTSAAYEALLMLLSGFGLVTATGVGDAGGVDWAGGGAGGVGCRSGGKVLGVVMSSGMSSSSSTSTPAGQGGR